jgi:ADP-heptose:LPS heptosyltransferase
MTGFSPRILRGYLAAFGDCLYATVIARQIKHDFPTCHHTWAIATPNRQIIEDNPYVDAIWEVPVSRGEAVTGGCRAFAREAEKRRKEGLFERVFFTQIPPDNFQNFDATGRISVSFHAGV